MAGATICTQFQARPFTFKEYAKFIGAYRSNRFLAVKVHFLCITSVTKIIIQAPSHHSVLTTMSKTGCSIPKWKLQYLEKQLRAFIVVLNIIAFLLMLH